MTVSTRWMAGTGTATDESGLTGRQREMLRVIHDFTRERGYPPTIRDLLEATRLASPNSILCHLKPLAKKGFLTRDRLLARSIRLTERARDALGVAAQSPEVQLSALRGEVAAVTAELEGLPRQGWTVDVLRVQVTALALRLRRALREED